MRAKIKLLQTRGVRRSDRDIGADLPISGELTYALCGGRYDLKLSAPDDSQYKPLVPILSEARLVGIHNQKMLFSGIEQPTTGGPQYGQQWSVLIDTA
jgi:hypothetical protein